MDSYLHWQEMAPLKSMKFSMRVWSNHKRRKVDVLLNFAD